jgi:hypothetical protein
MTQGLIRYHDRRLTLCDLQLLIVGRHFSDQDLRIPAWYYKLNVFTERNGSK